MKGFIVISVVVLAVILLGLVQLRFAAEVERKTREDVIENYCIKNVPKYAFYVTYGSTTAVFLEGKDRVEVMRVCE